MVYIKIFVDYLDAIEPLGDAERGRLFTALLEYARTGEVTQLSGNERFIFPMMKAQIDRDSTSLKEVSEQRSEAGRMGGLAKARNARKRKQEQDCSSKRSKVSKPGYEKDNDQDYDHNKENEEEAIYNNFAPAQNHEFARAVNAFESKLGVLRQDKYNELAFYVENMGADCCIKALDVAFSKGRDTANFGYTIGILKNKLSAGVHSIADWDKLEPSKKPQETAQATSGIKTVPTYHPDWYDEFMAVYPKRVAIPEAVEAWDNLKPDRELVDTIIKAVKAQKITTLWKEPKYIPTPAKWLNGARWLDDVMGMISDADLFM